MSVIWSSSCHGLGVHNLCFFQLELNWKVCSRATHGALQPVTGIQSTGSHERRSDLKRSEIHAVRMSGPPSQPFCFANPILQRHITCPDLSFQYGALLHWRDCRKAFLRGIYTGTSSSESKDATAEKPGTAWPLCSSHSSPFGDGPQHAAENICLRRVLEVKVMIKEKRQLTSRSCPVGFVSAQL